MTAEIPPETLRLAEQTVFRCVGNIGGCDKQGDDRCTFTVKGPPTQASESPYMCPFNHWRSAKWELTPNFALTETPRPATTGEGMGEKDHV